MLDREKTFCESYTYLGKTRRYFLPYRTEVRGKDNYILGASMVSCVDNVSEYMPDLVDEKVEIPKTFDLKFGVLDQEYYQNIMEAYKQYWELNRKDTDQKHPPFVYDGIVDNMMNLKRIYPSMCEKCERVHENENAYIFGIPKYDGYYVYYNCRRHKDSTLIGFLKTEQHYINEIQEIEEPDEVQITEEDLSTKNKECRQQYLPNDPYYVNDYVEQYLSKVWDLTHMPLTNSEARIKFGKYISKDFRRICRVITCGSKLVSFKQSENNLFDIIPHMAAIKNFADTAMIKVFHKNHTKAEIKNHFENGTQDQLIIEYEGFNIFIGILSDLNVRSREIIFKPYHMHKAQKHNPDRFNIFSGFKAKYRPDYSKEKHFHLFKPFLDHFRKVLCNDNEDHFKWNLSILAYPFRHLNRSDLFPVFCGDEGCGKSVLTSRFICPLLYGDQLSFEGDVDSIICKFNGHLRGIMFIAVNESASVADKKNAKSEAEKLKPVITEPTILIEDKGFRKIKFDNFINCWMYSNNFCPLHISETNRRIPMFECSSVFLNNTQYFIDLLKSFNQDAADYFYTYLLSDDFEEVEDLQHTIPETEIRVKSKLACLPKPVEFLNELLEQQIILEREDIYITPSKEVVMPSTTIYRYFVEFIEENTLDSSKGNACKTFINMITSSKKGVETKQYRHDGKNKRGIKFTNYSLERIKFKQNNSFEKSYPHATHEEIETGYYFLKNLIF
jgi:hypothetical protein